MPLSGHAAAISQHLQPRTREIFAHLCAFSHLRIAAVGRPPPAQLQNGPSHLLQQCTRHCRPRALCGCNELAGALTQVQSCATLPLGNTRKASFFSFIINVNENDELKHTFPRELVTAPQFHRTGWPAPCTGARADGKRRHSPDQTQGTGWLTGAGCLCRTCLHRCDLCAGCCAGAAFSRTPHCGRPKGRLAARSVRVVPQ